MRRITLHLLAISTCFTLALSLQASSESQLAQPLSIVPGTIPATKLVQLVERDAKVTPTGCADSCCGGADSCCGGKTVSGKAICCPKRTTVEVKKHCWNVKNETICIPGFRFQCNWKKRCKKGCDCGDTCCTSSTDCDCPPKCGRVRCIKVLEKHEYTCEQCGYEWEVKSVSTGKDRCCGGSCDCPSCGCAGY